MTDTVPSLYDSFALYGSGVTLVSVRDGEEHRFFIAASVLTASVNPFTIAISVAGHRDALPAIESGRPWTVSILAAQHLPLVRRLTARVTPTERWEALLAAGVETPHDGPIWLPDALVTLWCTTHSTTPVNDQVLLLGQVQAGNVHQDGTPLLRWNRQFWTVASLPSGPGRSDRREPNPGGTVDERLAWPLAT